IMTGTPSTSKHTLCLSLIPMRVPLPPARIIVTNGLFIIPRTPAPARSLRHRRGISKARSALRAGSQGRREEICGKTQFHLNSDPTSDVKTRHRLGGANVVTGESPRGNKGRIRGEHQENTKTIRRQHASAPQATGLQLARNWLVYGLGIASPDCVPRVALCRDAATPRFMVRPFTSRNSATGSPIP